MENQSCDNCGQEDCRHEQCGDCNFWHTECEACEKEVL